MWLGLYSCSNFALNRFPTISSKALTFAPGPSRQRLSHGGEDSGDEGSGGTLSTGSEDLHSANS